jgi:hypothetical protein
MAQRGIAPLVAVTKGVTGPAASLVRTFDIKGRSAYVPAPGEWELPAAHSNEPRLLRAKGRRQIRERCPGAHRMGSARRHDRSAPIGFWTQLRAGERALAPGPLGRSVGLLWRDQRYSEK